MNKTSPLIILIRLVVGFFLLFGAMITAFGQVKIGDNPTVVSPSAILETESTNKGFLKPRLTTAQRTAIASPATGLEVYDTDTKSTWYFDGTSWVDGASKNIYNTDGTLTGNRTVTQGANTLAFTSNATNGFSVDGTTFSVDGANNRVGIGTAAPRSMLANTTDNHLDASAHGIQQQSLTWVADQDGYAASVTNISTTGRGLLIKTGANNSNVAALDISRGSTTPAGTALFRVGSDGNVGIGTTSPSERLHVVGNLIVTSSSASSGATGITARPSSGSSSTGFAPFRLQNISGNTIFKIQQEIGAADDGIFFMTDAYDNGATESCRLAIRRSNGYVGIGTNTPNAALQFANTLVNRKVVLWEGANNDHQYFGLGVNGSTFRYQINSTGDSHVFYAGTSSSASAELMRITGTGSVGIGTASPNAKLHVNGTAGVGSPASYRFYELTAFNTYPGDGGIGKFSILATGVIATGFEFRAFSDKRIKEYVSPVDHAASLDVVRQLNIVHYSYKDKMKYGNGVKTGVFAQDVQKVFPEAVASTVDFIPNIYKLADAVGNSITGINTSELAVGDLLKIYVDENGEEVEKQVTVKALSANGVELTESLSAGKVFVFGKQVNDFLNLDYDRLTILSLSALKDLAKEHSLLEEKVQLQQAQINTLKSEMDVLKNLLQTYLEKDKSNR